MPRPAVITFYSYKGGVGRTMLAANVAVALASRGKTVLWDLDVEAPGLHRIRALRSGGEIERGFFDWTCEWQQHKRRPPGPKDLKAFEGLLAATPYTNLQIIPAHGDGADVAELYGRIDFEQLLGGPTGADPTQGRALFEALLDHLGEKGIRHVLIDSRTGLTALGAFLTNVIADCTVLVGGYGQQNLGGLRVAWQALRRDDGYYGFSTEVFWSTSCRGRSNTRRPRTTTCLERWLSRWIRRD